MKKNLGQKLIEKRPKTHGDFSDGARFTQAVMKLAMAMPAWERATDVQKEGIHMIVHKLQRALAGDPGFADHYADISGYAELIAARCKRG
jgi:hypothetical protein